MKTLGFAAGAGIRITDGLLHHPGGMEEVSRGLSAATPPVQRSENPAPRPGCGRLEPDDRGYRDVQPLSLPTSLSGRLDCLRTHIASTAECDSPSPLHGERFHEPPRLAICALEPGGAPASAPALRVRIPKAGGTPALRFMERACCGRALHGVEMWVKTSARPLLPSLILPGCRNRAQPFPCSRRGLQSRWFADMDLTNTNRDTP